MKDTEKEWVTYLPYYLYWTLNSSTVKKKQPKFEPFKSKSYSEKVKPSHNFDQRKKKKKVWTWVMVDLLTITQPIKWVLAWLISTNFNISYRHNIFNIKHLLMFILCFKLTCLKMKKKVLIKKPVPSNPLLIRCHIK